MSAKPNKKAGSISGGILNVDFILFMDFISSWLRRVQYIAFIMLSLGKESSLFAVFSIFTKSKQNLFDNSWHISDVCQKTQTQNFTQVHYLYFTYHINMIYNRPFSRQLWVLVPLISLSLEKLKSLQKDEKLYHTVPCKCEGCCVMCSFGGYTWRSITLEYLDWFWM